MSFTNNHEHTFLLLDEDQDLRSVLKSMISERFGKCKFYNSKTAIEAIRLVSEVKVDVIVSPLKNNVGFTLLKLCKEMSVTIPVMILSGDVSVQARDVKMLGAAAYVFKASSEETLYRAIHTCLQKAHSLNP